MSEQLQEALEDARQLRLHAAGLTYNDTTAEGEAKHRLNEIAMRLETGYYTTRAFKAGAHVGAGLERAAQPASPASLQEPDGIALQTIMRAYDCYPAVGVDGRKHFEHCVRAALATPQPLRAALAAQPASPASLPPIGQLGSYEMFEYPDDEGRVFSRPQWVVAHRPATLPKGQMWFTRKEVEDILATPQPSPTGPVKAQEQPAGEALTDEQIVDIAKKSGMWGVQGVDAGGEPFITKLGGEVIATVRAVLAARPQAASSPTGPREGEPMRPAELAKRLRAGEKWELAPETPSVRSLGERNSESVDPAQASALQAVPHDSRSTGASKP